MPKLTVQPPLTSDNLLHEVASILAKVVIRHRKQARTGENIDPGIRVEVPGNPILSVSLSTRRLGLRDDGDDA